MCGEPLPTAENYPAWCPSCEWGIPKPAEQEQGWLRSLANRWSARQVEALFKQVSGTTLHRPGWDLARVASYALAIVIHLCCVALLAVGVWLIATMPNVVTVTLAIIAILLAYELRPRLGSFRKLRDVRYRADAPVLFGVLDQVAAEVGAKPAYGVVVDGRWNASYSSVGWRRRRVVTLGLPLWEVLPAGQKVAILGHEFAHGVNGDARHGVIVGTSLATLARLHSVLLPDPLLQARMQRNGIVDQLAQAIMALLRGVIAALFMTQQLISLRAGQRAEYLADAIGARVASPDGMANALDALATGRLTYETVMERHANRQLHPVRRDSDPGLWNELRSALAAVPDSELERRRRVRSRALLQVTNTHPPTHLRVSMLRGLPPVDASVCLSAAQEDRIRAELAGDYARIGGSVSGPEAHAG
jgi:Zn-dependent protease with chaperone function